jgi:hypothetical protein
MSSLEVEISNGRREISADTISMSVSELTNLYREGILEIRPEFQRLFRWTPEQKSRLVESVLLGIPVPSLFVAQSEAGKWELVDGLQRVSTLLELQGVLRSEDGSKRPPLILTGTKYLPSLEGYSWEARPELSEAQKLDVRLARLDLRVIKRSSDPKAKFDLFQRLNSFGSALTAQEIRSAMIAGTDGRCLTWLLAMAARPEFVETVSLTERLSDEQYDVELVLRFLMLHDWPLGRMASLRDFSSRLDDWSLDFADGWEARYENLEQVFINTFGSIANSGGENAFRKWDRERERFRGSFSNTAFEVIALGLGFHVDQGGPHRNDIENAARQLWELPAITPRFTTGLGTHERLKRTIVLGRKLMASPPEEITQEDVVGT